MKKKRLRRMLGFLMFLFLVGLVAGAKSTADPDLSAALAPSYVYCDQPYMEGKNNIVESVGLQNDIPYHGKATCRGDWWVRPCEWQSNCSTGWEYDPKDFYPVKKCEICPNNYIYVDQPYMHGSNNIVEIVGLQNDIPYHGKGICRGDWWVRPCEWQSYCSTGWEYNLADYYPVEKCETCEQNRPIPWPMFGHDAQRTGRSSYQGVSQLSDQPLNGLAWKIKHNQVSAIPSRNQVISADGTLYTILQSSEINADGSFQHYLFELSPEGEAVLQIPVHWTFDQLWIGINNELYAQSSWFGLGWNDQGNFNSVYGGFIYGDADILDAAQGPDGTFYTVDYFPSATKYGVAAVDPYTKQEKWRFLLEGDVVYWSPLISLGLSGDIYLTFSKKEPNGEVKGTLYALNPDGTLKWELPEKWGVENSAVWARPIIGIGPDGRETIYLRVNHQRLTQYGDLWEFWELWAIDASGDIKWKYQQLGYLSDPAIGKDNTLYMTSWGGISREIKCILVAVEPNNGTLKWKFGDERPPGVIESASLGFYYQAPSISSNGTIFVSSQNVLYAVNPDGSLRQKFEIPVKEEFSTCAKWYSPVIDDARGMVYAIGYDGESESGSYLYAFGGNN